MHLSYVHRARAIAIVAIVALHCVGSLDWSNNFQTYRFMVELLQGATVVFVMISGFLFQHLSHKFHYQQYLWVKFKNVIVPYLFVGLPGILLLLTKPSFLAENPELIDAGWPARVAFLYLYSGSQLNYVLWFIPVLTIYYVFAPLFMKMLRRPAWFISLLILIPVSMFAHRPSVQKYHHLDLALYFLSAYLTGMWAGLYREKVFAFLDRYFALALACYLVVLVGHFRLSNDVGSYVEEIFSGEKGLIDWIFIQKMLLFFVLIAALKRVENMRAPAVDYVASVSFAIFFLHVYVLHVYGHVVHWHQYPGTVINALALLALTLACTVGMTCVSRMAFGPTRSRLLIGA
jgi:hypothetical protein